MTTNRPFVIGLFTFGVITAAPLTRDRVDARIDHRGMSFTNTVRSIELLTTEVLPVIWRETSAATKEVA
jgi:hypothetical protein